VDAPTRPRDAEGSEGEGASTGSGENDWGAQFGLDEAPRKTPAAGTREGRAPVAGTPPPRPSDDELRFDEDEGPSTGTPSSRSGAAIQEDEDPSLAAGSTASDDEARELAEATDAYTSGEDVEVSDELPPTPVSEEIEVSEEPGTAFEETSAALAASGAPAPVRAVTPTSAATGSGPGVNPPMLTAWAPTAVLPGVSSDQPFVQGPASVAVAVNGELLTRLEGLIAVQGQVTFQPEMKRFRGRATDKPFGEGVQAMVRARGQGTLHLEPAASRQLVAMVLDDESVYLRDACVFAFEEPVVFENGRVPSDLAPDLDLVHLRGQGRVLLSLSGPLRSVPVTMDAPVSVPLSHLVGWLGNLTPRVVPLLQSAGGETLRSAVELGGEGFALIALGVR
ncbi:AIM24 family protein, partial [Corallococcus terminator]